MKAEWLNIHFSSPQWNNRDCTKWNNNIHSFIKWKCSIYIYIYLYANAKLPFFARARKFYADRADSVNISLHHLTAQPKLFTMMCNYVIAGDARQRSIYICTMYIVCKYTIESRLSPAAYYFFSTRNIHLNQKLALSIRLQTTLQSLKMGIGKLSRV